MSELVIQNELWVGFFFVTDACFFLKCLQHYPRTCSPVVRTDCKRISRVGGRSGGFLRIVLVELRGETLLGKDSLEAAIKSFG